MLRNPLITLATGDIALSAAAIAVYTVISIIIAVARLTKSDITKKAD